MLAYWHKPVFNSGRHVPGHISFADEWAQLDDAGVDLVLNGHDHNYQRYAPQNSEGEATEAGMRQFIVGSGGAKLYEQSTTAPKVRTVTRAVGVAARRTRAVGPQEGITQREVVVGEALCAGARRRQGMPVRGRVRWSLRIQRSLHTSSQWVRRGSDRTARQT